MSKKIGFSPSHGESFKKIPLFRNLLRPQPLRPSASARTNRDKPHGRSGTRAPLRSWSLDRFGCNTSACQAPNSYTQDVRISWFRS
jgi:hypothetical protein